MAVLNNYPDSPPAKVFDLTVFFDGACPLCRREISFYQRRASAHSVDFIDVSQHTDFHPSLSQSAAMARFHVADAHGQLYSGGHAFVLLWQHIPGFVWAGRVLALPGLRHLTNFMYDRFLTIRPWLQRWASPRHKATCDNSGCR